MSGRSNVNTMTTTQIIQLIEETVQLVQQSPETNIKELQPIVDLLAHDNLIIVQIALMSLTELFIDIAPLYKIDKNAHQQKLSKFINKDEKLVLQFELSLLNLYHQFTDALFTFLRTVSPQQSCDLLNNCYICLAKLTQSLFHFNFMRSLVQHLVYGLLQPGFQENCSFCIASILENKKHSLHELKIEILSFITKLLQTKPEHELPDYLISMVNSLQIDTKFLPQFVEKEEREKRKQLKQAKRDFFSQKEKDKKKQKQTKEQIAHHKKLLKEVEAQKQEASADLDKKTLAKQNGEILAKIFYIFFKIIKAPRLSKFYEDALTGVLKFVHLINVELIQSLISSLIASCQQLRKQTKKDYFLKVLHLRLSTVDALIQIIDGPAQAFEVDDKETTAQLYTCLLDWANRKERTEAKVESDEGPKHSELERTLLQQVQHTFIRKRHFSQDSAGSFVKLMMQLAVKTDSLKFALSLLFGVKLILQKYTKTQKMVEEDNEGFGLNAYSTRIEDPSSTNALNSSIHEELEELKKKYKREGRIVSLVEKVLKNDRLAPHMVNKTIMDVFLN